MEPLSNPLNIARPSGRLLSGTLVAPAEASLVNAGVIVFTHGMLSFADHNFAPALSVEVAKRLGIAAYRFNFRGNEPCEAEPEHRYRLPGFEGDVDDLRVVVAHFRASGVPVRAFIGHSRGSNAVLMLLSQEEDAAAFPPCVVVAPRFRMDGMLRLFPAEQVEAVESGAVPHFVWSTKIGDIPVTAEDVRYIRGMDMAGVVRERCAEEAAAPARGGADGTGRPYRGLPASLPVLLLHGTEDITIPAEDAHLLMAARPQTHLRIVPGAKHTFAGSKHTKILIDGICAWLQAVLAGAVPAEDATASCGGPAAVVSARGAAAPAAGSPRGAGKPKAAGGASDAAEASRQGRKQRGAADTSCASSASAAAAPTLALAPSSPHFETAQLVRMAAAAAALQRLGM